MTNWKNYFDAKVLQRGQHYYQRHLVHHFRKTRANISATVVGTHAYHVAISTLDSPQLTMTCDCPYFKAGHACKHLAATFYQADFASGAALQPPVPKPLVSSMTAVHSAPGQIIIDFFDQVIAEDETALYQFGQLFFDQMLPVRPGIPLIDKPSFWQTFNQAAPSALPSIAGKLMVILDDHPLAIKSNQYLPTAFNLTTRFYLSMFHHHFDNLSDDLFDAVHHYSTGWLKMYRAANHDLRSQMFSWFCQYAAKLSWIAMGPLQDMLFEFHIFEHPAELQMKLVVIDNRLAQLRCIDHDSPSMLPTWQVEWRRYRVGTMATLQLSSTVIRPFCVKNIDDPFVVAYFLDVCRIENDHRTALDYLNEGIQMAQASGDTDTRDSCESAIKYLDMYWQHPFDATRY